MTSWFERCNEYKLLVLCAASFFGTISVPCHIGMAIAYIHTDTRRVSNF